MREPINFTGTLNTSDELLPDGDYTEARNVLIDEGLDGGRGSIKKMSSISSFATNLDGVSGTPTVVASCIDEDQVTYALLRLDTSDARIVSITTSGTVTTLLTYNHNSASIDPDMVIVGNVLVWNYYGSGTPLSWDVTRAVASGLDTSDITFIKPVPADFTITPSSSGGANDVLESGRWDFAAQYVYDTGEVSALSHYQHLLPEPDSSDVNYGLDGVGQVTLTIASTHPTYATQAIFYARKDNGSWRRIDTVDVPATKTNDITLVFTGLLNETLDTETSSKPFDSVPVTALAVELAKNRIFLGNIQDDLGNDTTDISISVTTGGLDATSFPFGSGDQGTIDTPYAYFDFIDATDNDPQGIYESVNPTLSGPDQPIERKGLANDSTYKVGVALYDEYMRTRGVEDYVEVSTGLFDGTFRIEDVTLTGSTFPSWAKYWKIVMTRNLTKDYYIEGYASSIYYELESGDGTIFYRNNVVSSDSVRRAILYTDIPYTYQEGDICKLNISSYRSVNKIVKAQVLGSEGNNIYLEFVDGMGEFSRSSYYNFFEIYSPSDQTDDPVFYETGAFGEITSLPSADTDLADFLYDSVLAKQKTSPPSGRLITSASSSIIVNVGTPDTLASQNNGSGTFVKIGFDTNYEDNSSGTADAANDQVTAPESVDVIVTGRINISKTLATGSPYPNLSISLYRTASSALSVVSNIPLDEAQDFYDFSYEFSETSPAGDWNIRIKLEDADATVNNSSIDIENGTFLSVTAKDDYNTATFNNETSTVRYGLRRQLSLVKGRTLWDRKAEGKPLLTYENKPITNQTNKIRWGGKFIFNAKQNLISSFFSADQAEVGYEAGAITKLVRTNRLNQAGTVMLAISTRETNSLYIEERVLASNDGATQIVASDQVIGSIRPLQGSFGTIHKGSVVRNTAGNVYFWDSNEREVIRYSREGLMPISRMYKMAPYFQDKSGTPTAFYDEYHDMYFIQFSGDSDMISFKENKGWTSYWDFTIDAGGPSFDRRTIVFKGNTAYLTLTPSTVNSFLGSSPTPSITLRKTMITPAYLQAISLKGNGYKNYANQNFVENNSLDFTITNIDGQSTTFDNQLLKHDGELMYAPIPFDENSSGGKWEGIRLFGSEFDFKIDMDTSLNSRKIEYVLLDFQQSPVN